MGRQEPAGADQNSERCCAEELREVPERAGRAAGAQDHSKPKTQAWWDQPRAEGPDPFPSPVPSPSLGPSPSPGPQEAQHPLWLTWVLVPHPQQLPLLKLLQYMGDYLPLPRYSSQTRKLRLREGESLAVVLWQGTDTAGTGTQASCSFYAPLGCATLTNRPASSEGRKRISDLGVLAIANPCAECCAWISSSGPL